MPQKKTTSIPAIYLFICILINLILIILLTNLPANQSWLAEIIPILVLIGRGVLGIYLGWNWFSKVKRDIYPTDWIPAIIINGIFLVVVIFIVSLIVPNAEKNVLMWPYSGFVLFMGTDMLVTLFCLPSIR